MPESQPHTTADGYDSDATVSDVDVGASPVPRCTFARLSAASVSHSHLPKISTAVDVLHSAQRRGRFGVFRHNLIASWFTNVCDLNLQATLPARASEQYVGSHSFMRRPD